MSRMRFVVACALLGTTSGVAACVDLFHATDFQTLCDVDAAACATTTSVLEAGAPDADDVTPSLCTSEARAQARTVCGFLGACLGPLRRTRFGECEVQAELAFDCVANPVLRPRGAVARAWDCLAKATTCEAVQACVFPSGVQTCQATTAGTYEACGRGPNASTLVSCGPSTTPVGVEPCALFGQTCTTLDTTTNEGACTGAAAKACTGASRCDGTSAVVCAKPGGGVQRDVGLDCASVGAGRCTSSLANGPGCVPGDDAESCTSEEGQLACSGGRVQTCIDGRKLTVDCVTLGLGCVPQPARGAWDYASWCRTPADASTCDTELDADRCEGTKLVTCRRGVPATVDCASLGLQPCKAQGNGAACAAP